MTFAGGMVTCAEPGSLVTFFICNQMSRGTAFQVEQEREPAQSEAQES